MSCKSPRTLLASQSLQFSDALPPCSFAMLTSAKGRCFAHGGFLIAPQPGGNFVDLRRWSIHCNFPFTQKDLAGFAIE